MLRWQFEQFIVCRAFWVYDGVVAEMSNLLSNCAANSAKDDARLEMWRLYHLLVRLQPLTDYVFL